MPPPVIWKTKLGADFSGTFLSLIANRLVCAVSERGIAVLKAWSVEGKRLWATPCESNRSVRFFPFGEDAFVDGHEALRVRAEDGAVVGRRNFGDLVLARPPAANGPAYLVGGMANPGSLIGLDPQTLDTAWEIPDGQSHVCHGRVACCYRRDTRQLETVGLPDLTVQSVAAPFDRDDPVNWHVHAAGLWCQLFEQQRYGVDLATGALVWAHDEPEPGWHGYITTVADDRLYCGNRGISCYLGSTGELAWRQTLDGSSLSCRFHIVDEGIWAATQARSIYLVNRADGSVLAQHRLDDEPMAIAPVGDRRVAVATSDRLLCVEL